MSLMYVNATELRRALAEIEAAEANGFQHCLAVVEPARVNIHGNLELRYSDLWERASDDPSGRHDWGRFQGVTRRHRFENGRLVKLAAPTERGEDGQ